MSNNPTIKCIYNAYTNCSKAVQFSHYTAYIVIYTETKIHYAVKLFIMIDQVMKVKYLLHKMLQSWYLRLMKQPLNKLRF